MKIFTLNKKQTLDITPEEAWNFFSSPVNLAAITPEWLGFRIVSELPDKIYPGLIINYKVSPLLGISLNWVTEITHVNELYYFVDEQRFGPYKFWHHQHHFRPVSGGVEIEDIVNYALPAAGALINKLLVKKKLDEIFNYRYNFLKEKFNSA